MMNPEDLAEERKATVEEFWFRRNPAGMKENENEARFQIIRNVTELQSFTISEINELVRIPLEKKWTCEEERVQMKQSQTSSGPHRKVRPPPLHEDVLGMIFSQLPKSDIFCCRLVCRDWSSAGAMELRNHICKSLDFYGPYTVHSHSQIQKDDLEEFLNVISKSQLLPVNSFHLNMKRPGSPSQFWLMQNFFQVFGPIMKSLTLDFSNYLHHRSKNIRPSGPLETHLYGVSLEMLQSLTVKFHNLNEDSRVLFTTDYFAVAQNLQKLHFESDKNSAELVKSLENSTLRYLNTLFLETSTLYDKELRHLGRVINLKHLTLKINRIGFQTETMKEFLESQSKLEYLKLFPYQKKTEFLYEFPRMKSLKMLSILSSLFDSLTLYFARIDWNLSFPKLEELQICEIMANHWITPLFPSDSNQVHLGLKTINLPEFRFNRSLIESLPVMSRIFPNVQIVKMYFDDLFRPILSNWFPNLYKITVRDSICDFDYNYSVDEAKNSLEVFVMDLKLGPGKKDFRQDLLKCVDRLTEFDFDLNNLKMGEKMGPKIFRRTHDCTWFLELLRQRIKSRQIKDELLANGDLSSDSSSDSASYGDGDGDDYDYDHGHDHDHDHDHDDEAHSNSCYSFFRRLFTR